MDTSSASTAQLTTSNAHKILSPSNMQVSSTEKLLLLRERGSSIAQSQLGLEIQQDQGVSQQMKKTFYMESSDASKAANNTSNMLNSNSIAKFNEINPNNTNQLTVGIMETSMNLNQPIMTTQMNILTTNPGETNNNANNLNILDTQSSNSSQVNKNTSAIKTSIITSDMRSRLKNKHNLSNRAKQGSSTQKIKDTPTNNSNNNQTGLRVSTDTSESYFHLTQNNTSNPKIYPEPLLKLNNKKLTSINDSFKDQSKQQSFTTTLQVPGMSRAASRTPGISIGSLQKIPAGSPRKVLQQSMQNQQPTSSFSAQAQPSKGGSSLKRLFSFIGRRFNSRPSNASNTPSSSQHNINTNNNNNSVFNFNNSSGISNQQGNNNNSNNNLPGASAIHSMFQVVQAAALNENVVLPSTTTNNNQLNQPNEINPGTNWNFVKKLAKVKKFIDSLKTANLYQSFYKVRSTHLSLISDTCDFSLYNDSKRAEFYYQMAQQSHQSKQYSLQSISFFSNLFGYVESGVARLPLFLPHQPLLNWFKVAMMLISVITLVVVPLFGCFSLMSTLINNRYSFLFMIPFALFFIEILISLNTAYYEEGDIQVNRVKIIKQYTKTALWIDLSSTFACVFLFADQQLIFVLLVMIRILKVNTYRRDINEYFYIQQRANTLYTLVNLIVSVMIVAHYFACGFNYMAVIEETFFDKDSWIITLGIDQYSWVSRYINAVYFSFITMVTVGFGDIKPTTDPEKVYVTFVALTSSLIFAYTVNTIGTVFQEIAQQEAEYKSQKYHLSVYMRSRSINQQLQTRVMKYLDHMIHKQLESPQKGQEILKRMSKKIRDDIYKDFFGKILLSSKMFKFNFSEPFIKELTTQMKEIICRPGETIFSFNEADNRIFFINKGEVELFLEKQHKKDEQRDDTYSYGCLQVIQSYNFRERKGDNADFVKHFDFSLNLQKDDIFGEYSFFTSKLREMSAKSLTVSHLVYCTYEDFSVVLQQFPKDYEKFCQMKDEVMIYGEQLNTKCGACDRFRHSIFDCPYVHLVRRRENVIHKHIRSIPNERCTHDRQKGVKNNALYMNLNVRIKLRKLRREYVESKFGNASKKDELNAQTANINDRQNTNSNILLDDNKAGYNISLKKSEQDDDSSQISVKSETKAEMRRFTDKKFFQATPKLILDAEYQICIDREEDEVIEEFEDEDSEEEEEEEGEYLDGSNSGNQNDFEEGEEEEEDGNAENEEEDFQDSGQDEMLGDVYDEDENDEEENEFTSENDSKGNSHNNSRNSDWREENEGHKDSIFKTLDARNKRKLKEQQESEGIEQVNEEDAVLKNEFSDQQGIVSIIKKATNRKTTPRMTKQDKISQENDCQEDNSSSKSSSDGQHTSRGQAQQEDQDNPLQPLGSSRNELAEVHQAQQHQEMSLTSFGELLVDQRKKSLSTTDKKSQLIFKGSVFQLKIADLATQQQKRAEQAREQALNFEKLPEEEQEYEDDEIGGNLISEFARTDLTKTNRQSNSQFKNNNSNQPSEMFQRSMTISQKAAIFHNKTKSSEKSFRSGKPLKHQRSLTDSPLFSSTIVDHRGLKRSSLSSSSKQYQLAKRASAASFNQLASFQMQQMNNQQKFLQQKQQELEQFIQEQQRGQQLADESNQSQSQQADLNSEKKRIPKRFARQSSFQKGTTVANNANLPSVTKNFSSRSIDHPGILKHKIERMGSMALNLQDLQLQSQTSQSFLQQQISPPNMQLFNNMNASNPIRPIVFKSENSSSFQPQQQPYPGKETDVILLRRKTEKKNRNSQFIAPQLFESPGIISSNFNNINNNNNAQMLGLNSNRMSSLINQAPPEVMITPIDDPRMTNLPLQRKSTKQSIISSEYLQLPDNSISGNGLLTKSAMPPVSTQFNAQQQQPLLQQQIPLRKTLNFKQTTMINTNSNEFAPSGWLQTQNSLQNQQVIQQPQGSSPQNQLSMSNVSPYKKSQSIIPSAKQQFLSSKSIGNYGVTLQQPQISQNPNIITNPLQQLQSQKSLQTPQIILQQSHIQGIQQQQQQVSQQQLLLGQTGMPMQQVSQNMLTSAPSPGGGGIQGQIGQIGAFNMWNYPQQQQQQSHQTALNHLLTAGTSELGLLQEEALLQSTIEYRNHKALFWYDFDKMKEFTNYFPHNNYTVVCKEKRKQLVNRKNYFANRKFLGPSTRNLLMLASKQQSQQQAQLNPLHPSPKGILGNSNNNSNMSLNQSMQGSIAKSPNLLSVSTKLLQSLHANPSFSALLNHTNKNNKSTKNLFASSQQDHSAANINSALQLSQQGSSISSSNEPSQMKIKKTASKLFSSANNNRSFRLNTSKQGLQIADQSPLAGESFNSSNNSIINPIKQQLPYKISEIVPIQQSSAENTERHESYRPSSPPDNNNLKVEELQSPELGQRLKEQSQKLFMGTAAKDDNVKTDNPQDM